MRGTVDKFTQTRGFGFIRAEGNGGRYFFHVTDCPAPLRQRLEVGLEVAFTPTSTPQGPRARDVTG